jgi:hypothetical protein
MEAKKIVAYTLPCLGSQGEAVFVQVSKDRASLLKQFPGIFGLLEKQQGKCQELRDFLCSHINCSTIPASLEAARQHNIQSQEPQHHTCLSPGLEG